MVRCSNIVVLSLLCLLPLASTACRFDAQAGEEKGKEDKAEKEDTAVPVQVVTLAQGPIEAVLRFSTNLEAEAKVQVLAEAARQVRKLAVEEGDVVRRGQLLLRLQDDEQRTAVAKVDSELAKVRREYDRQQRLFEQGFLSEEDFSNATYQIEQLELRQTEAKRELSYTEVRAPIAGTVTGRHVNLGDHISPNQHLFDIVDFDSIVARIFVPEKELARLRAGQEARLSAPSLGDGVHLGRIERIAPVVDPQSGTVKVTVAIPESQALRPGLYVDVELVTDVHEDALLVPKRALVYDQDQVFVYRLLEKPALEKAVPENTVERVRVRTLLENKEYLEPVDGLEAEDQLVIAGQAGLKEGAQVRLVSAIARENEQGNEALAEAP